MSETENTRNVPCADCIEGRNPQCDRVAKCHNGRIEMCSYLALRATVEAREREISLLHSAHLTWESSRGNLEADLERARMETQAENAKLLKEIDDHCSTQEALAEADKRINALNTFKKKHEEAGCASYREFREQLLERKMAEGRYMTAESRADGLEEALRGLKEKIGRLLKHLRESDFMVHRVSVEGGNSAERFYDVLLEFEDELKFTAPRQVAQRQDSLKDQMNDVYDEAVEMGCYDAADWISKCFRAPRHGEGEETVEEKYQELIYAVEHKWPNETRHETALRYIRQAETTGTSGTANASPTEEQPNV